MKQTLFTFFILTLFSIGFTQQSKACDFSPSVSASNLVDNGDGTWSFDVLMCVGERGSENGPTIYLSDGINILETTAPDLINPFNGNTAASSITGGTISYTFPGAPAIFWVEDNDEFGPCFSFTLTVDSDPSSATISFEDINDNCFNDISGGVWTTTVSGGGTCSADLTMTAPASISGNTNGAGNDCDLRPSDDQTIEVIIPCDGVYTFTTCDAASWDTYMFLSLDCCEGVILENDDWCGAQSEITSYLPAGTYYITIEGFFDFNDGEFELEVIEGEPLYKAETGPDQDICETTTTISGNAPIFGTGQWSVITGGGTIIDPNSPTTDVINLSNGLNEFVWAFGEEPCISSADTIRVIAAGNLTITCPEDITVDNDPGDCSAVVNYDLPTGSSECSDVTITQIGGLGSGSAFPVGITLETYLVEDTLGNADSCTVVITVLDVEAPSIDCIDNFSVNNDPGLCSAVVDFNEPLGTDNCPGAITTLINGLPSGSEFPAGTTVNVYQVTDGAGNTNTCVIEITVEDTEPPVLDCPEDILIELEEGECFTVVDYDLPTATDNCPGVGAVFQTDGLGPNVIFPTGVTTETYQVTDAAGNTTTCSFTVTVIEPVNPEITCPENIVVANDPGECSAVVNYIPPFGTDDCPGATTALIEGLGPGATFPVGTTTEVYQVTDASGNTAECAFTVTVEDNEEPEITCPDDITVDNDEGQCGAIVDFIAPAGADNCPNFTVSLVSPLGPGDFFPVGNTTVSYLIEDEAGLVATCSFNVEVIDVEPPVAQCSDIVVDNDPGECHAVLNYDEPTATDNCDDEDITAVLVSGQGPGGTFEVGTTYEEVWEFFDAAGNSTQCTISIVVVDAEEPIIECPEDQVIVLDEADCFTDLDYEIPTASDNCPGVVVTLISGPTPGTTVPAGEQTIVIGAEDAAGNTTTCSFTITVIETVDPTIECPQDIVAFSTEDDCGTVVDYVTPVGEDNCPGATTAQTEGLGSGSFFPVGTTTETYTITDLSGNTATCSFTITVVDTIAPVIDCPEDITVQADGDDCTAVVNFPTPTATDNCDDVTISQTGGSASGSEFTVGVHIIEFEAEDESGNTTTCTFTITVEGNSEVTITCPGDIVVSTDPDSCGAVVEFSLPVADDSCGGDITLALESGLESGSVFPVGTTTIVYTATNSLGNSASCSFDVIVVDEEAPEINCPENIQVFAPADACVVVVDYDNPTATDNCEVESLELIEGEASGSTFDIGVHTITYEATDASGNTTTCSFTIEVIDEIDPTISECPANISVDSDPETCGAVVNYEAPVGDDNCEFTISVNDGFDSGAFFPVGTTTVVWTVTDASGNTVSCSFEVTVVDVTPPIITCPEDFLTCDPAIDIEVEATDNCGAVSVEQIIGPGHGAEYPIGTTEVTYEATDAAGNTATCSFIVTVEEAPDTADAGPDQLICDDDQTELEGNNPEVGIGFWEIVSGTGDIADASDPNTSVTNIAPDSLVLSWTIIGAGVCPSTTDFVTIYVEPDGFVDAGENVTISGGESTNLTGTVSSEGGTWQWSPSESLSCSDCPNPTASPSATTTYTVTYTTALGCEYQDQVTVTVFSEIPTGFTPGNDGANDVWNIPNVTENTEVLIYNRWGNKIFESVGYQEPWDGTYENKDLPMGTFYYVIDFRDGTDPINGTVTLIR